MKGKRQGQRDRAMRGGAAAPRGCIPYGLVKSGVVARMSRSAARVLVVLAGHASNQDGRSHPAQKLIASEAGVHERTVRKALAELEDLDAIERERRPGRCTAYRLRTPALARPRPALQGAGGSAPQGAGGSALHGAGGSAPQGADERSSERSPAPYGAGGRNDENDAAPHRHSPGVGASAARAGNGTDEQQADTEVDAWSRTVGDVDLAHYKVRWLARYPAPSLEHVDPRHDDRLLAGCYVEWQGDQRNGADTTPARRADYGPAHPAFAPRLRDVDQPGPGSSGSARERKRQP